METPIDTYIPQRRHQYSTNDNALCQSVINKYSIKIESARIPEKMPIEGHVMLKSHSNYLLVRIRPVLNQPKKISIKFQSNYQIKSLRTSILIPLQYWASSSSSLLSTLQAPVFNFKSDLPFCIENIETLFTIPILIERKTSSDK